MWLDLNKRVPNHLENSAICGSNLEETYFSHCKVQRHALHPKQWRGKAHTWARKRQVPQTKQAIKFCCWMKTSKTGADLCTATITLLNFADTRPRLSKNCKCDAFVESTNS